MTEQSAFSFSYFTAGNIINLASQTEAEDTVTLQSASMEYDAANRLVKYNNENVLYDADGNMTYGPLNGVMTTFTYDCRNRLVSAGNTTYGYDAENNRISVTVSGTTTSYVVENNSGELSKILSSTTGNKTTLFVYGNGLLAQKDADNGYLYYHFNNIGSTTAVTDGDGKLKYAFSYGTYGELLSGDTHGIQFLYNGQYGVVTDSNGLYYMRARYYNVDIKRFINQDVVEGSITNSPSLNKYAYCQGNPVSLLDPFGLSPQGVGSFVGHLVLDVLGYIPVVGIVADIANGIWYIAEGNYFCAAMSFIAAIPLIGDAFGLTAEGAKYACTFNKLILGTKALGNLATFGRSLSQISAISADITQKLLSDEDWELEDTIEVLTGLGYIAEALLSAYDLGHNLNDFSTISNQCFVAGTLVLTIDGNKPIEEIKAGDLVYSTDPETGESEYKEVVQTFENEAEELVHISVAGEEIVTTLKHPFYVPQKGWTSAIDLRAGDILVLSNGEYVIVEKVQHEILESPVKVYNFEVKDYHTYYVGENSVLVHNMCEVENSEPHAQENNNNETELFLPDEFYEERLPKFVTPGTQSLSKYDEFGNLKQIKYYDDYGREIGWIDFTDHGYPQNHTVPHWHEVQWNAQYPIGGYKIDHRTDANPPFIY